MKEQVSVMISEERLNERIRQIAEELNRDFAGKELHLICILKGSLFFVCELSKHLTMPVTIDCMSVASYGDGTTSNRQITMKLDLTESIEGKNVLVVEDIIDSGNTLSYLLKLFESRRPAVLRLCTLLDKPERREQQVDVDYVGFQIPDAFVVGFGLDYAQRYRNLPYIGVLKLEEGENS